MKNFIYQKKNVHEVIKLCATFVLIGLIFAIIFAKPYYVEVVDLSSGRWEEYIDLSPDESGHISYQPGRHYVYNTGEKEEGIFWRFSHHLDETLYHSNPFKLLAGCLMLFMMPLAAIVCMVAIWKGRMGIAALSSIGLLFGLHYLNGGVLEGDLSFVKEQREYSVSTHSYYFEVMWILTLAICAAIWILAMKYARTGERKAVTKNSPDDI